MPKRPTQYEFRLRSKSPPGSKKRPMPQRQTQLEFTQRHKIRSKAFNSILVLRHPNPALKIRVEPDTSGFAAITTPGILVTQNATCIIELRAESSRLWKHWRHYLEGSRYPITVSSDHANLRYFMTTKSLTGVRHDGRKSSMRSIL